MEKTTDRQADECRRQSRPELRRPICGWQLAWQRHHDLAEWSIILRRVPGWNTPRTRQADKYRWHFRPELRRPICGWQLSWQRHIHFGG
eukprot:765054-Amphidinium_carterae.1